MIILRSTFLLILISLLFFGCKKTEESSDDIYQDDSTYHFEAKIDEILSVASTFSMSEFNSTTNWITTSGGTNGFNRGSIGIKIDKNYLTEGSFILNSSTKDKYSAEFLTTTYGEVDSIYSTAYSNVDGLLVIDEISDYKTGDIFNNVCGRFAFQAVDKNSGNKVAVTYGKFCIVAHKFLFD